MKVGFLTFDRDRQDKTGSARIRAGNLIKYELDFELFKTGRKYDAVVFQKYYWYDYARLYDGIKILDICDPDWLVGGKDLEIVRMIEDMDGVVANTEATAKYIRKLTDKPVIVVEDRHDIAEMKERKIHKGRAKSVVWFGYSHNSQVLRPYIPKLVEEGLDLIIIADKHVTISGHQYSYFKNHEHFVKWPAKMSDVNKEMLKADFALLPKSRRPFDQYKSNNKTTHCLAIGLPVAVWGDDIDRFLNEEERIKETEESYDIIRDKYDCRRSADEYRDFINHLGQIREKRDLK